MNIERGVQGDGGKKEPLILVDGARLAAMDSLYLTLAFREQNRRLGVPAAAQQRVDALLLWQGQETHPSLPDHGRRVGGYAGALIRDLGGQFGNAYFEGRGRVMGSLHDIGKTTADRSTIMRALGVGDSGEFDRGRDMPVMQAHAQTGFDIVAADKLLPYETKFVVGCHHRYAADGEEPYGVPLEAIDEAYQDDPGMREWLHFAVRCVAAADIFDAAMSRDDGYEPSKGAYEVARERLVLIFPDSWQLAMDALQRKRTSHDRILQASTAVVAAAAKKV